MYAQHKSHNSIISARVMVIIILTIIKPFTMCPLELEYVIVVISHANITNPWEHPPITRGILRCWSKSSHSSHIVVAMFTKDG